VRRPPAEVKSGPRRRLPAVQDPPPLPARPKTLSPYTAAHATYIEFVVFISGVFAFVGGRGARGIITGGALLLRDR
jgi:hypothetical protein